VAAAVAAVVEVEVVVVSALSVSAVALALVVVAVAVVSALVQIPLWARGASVHRVLLRTPVLVLSPMYQSLGRTAFVFRYALSVHE